MAVAFSAHFFRSFCDIINLGKTLIRKILKKIVTKDRINL